MNVNVNKFPLWLLLIIIAMILLPSVIAGFEVCDSGFYLTFYDNFYHAPDSVEYNFMYYLTGIIGGAIDGLGDSYGVLRMRIAGLLFLLASVAIAWRYDRQIVSPRLTAMAIMCVMAAYTSYPLTLSYDIVSLLLITITVSLLVKGIIEGDSKSILFSGLCAGILIFARIPNLLQFLLIFLIPIYSKADTRGKWRYMLWFAAGYAVGILIVIAYMGVYGHLEAFISNMKTLVNISGDPDTSHGFGKLILVPLRYYFGIRHLGILHIIIKFSAIAVCLWGVCSIVRKRWLKVLCSLPLASYYVWVVMQGSPLAIIGAVTVPALIIVSVKQRKEKAGIISAAALLSSIIFPLGSDGVNNVGSIIYLLGAAPALNYWLNLRIAVKRIYFYIPSISIWLATIIFTVVNFGRSLCGELYFDETPIWKMTSRSSNPKLAGILMSEERAEVIDDAVTLLDDYVSPGDTLFVWGSSPMLNYLTSTRPYIGNSWPEQVSASRLDYLLRKEESRNREMPVVCVQRFHTLGPHWGNPSEAYKRGEDADSNIYHSAKKWLVVEDFLRRNGYHLTASTDHYELYTAPAQ